MARPEIYYGENTNDYVIVKTTTPEFDYPKGDDNVYVEYQGNSGVGVGSYPAEMTHARSQISRLGAGPGPDDKPRKERRGEVGVAGKCAQSVAVQAALAARDGGAVEDEVALRVCGDGL